MGWGAVILLLLCRRFYGWYCSLSMPTINLSMADSEHFCSWAGQIDRWRSRGEFSVFRWYFSQFSVIFARLVDQACRRDISITTLRFSDNQITSWPQIVDSFISQTRM
jgi:hypothetical protein